MSKLIRSNNNKMYIFLIIFLLLINAFNIPTSALDDLPDLTIDTVELPEDFIEGENLEFVVKIKNQGTKNVSAETKIGVALKIDYSIVATNASLNGLPAGSSIFINLSWTPTYDDIGEHPLTIEVDYEKIIYEGEGENNNWWDSNIEVLEKYTELEITDINIPDFFGVNETAIIYATIKNNGKNTTDPIFAKLNSSVDGEVDTDVKGNELSRGETHVFLFNWAPSQFGSQKISIEIIYKSQTHDFELINIVVGIGQLQWWNSSWHYRQFLTVTGNGNVAESFNFTELLNDLGIYSQSFENNTIRIIEYLKEGNIVGEIDSYKFNESIDFDPVNNAIGILIWTVAQSSDEKYYAIYFDVTSNQGDRTELAENDDIAQSGDAEVDYIDLVEGWWLDFLEPENGSYSIIDNPIDIAVSTPAKAENVSAYIFNESYNITINLIEDVDENTLWKYEDYYFQGEGNWTIRISGIDGADYEPMPVEHVFFVGQPDIEIINITYTTNWPPTSPKIYTNDTVNFTAYAIAHDASVENVNVSFSVYDIDNDQIVYTDYTIVTISKDNGTYISFNWKAGSSSKYNITITLDPDNQIFEQNESNNEITETVTVYSWPDLKVQDIILPSKDITEYDEVAIYVVVKNIGEGDAEDYELKLFIESAEQEFMTYTNSVDSDLVSVKVNSSKTVKMIWDSAAFGEWFVAAKIFENNTKRDTNVDNNRLLSNISLMVKPIERNKPVISKPEVKPSRPEQGEAVTITVNVTDDSGIESVMIEITNPQKVTQNGTMVRTTEDYFKFTFYDTLVAGNYGYTIEAIDISINKNKGTRSGVFKIYEDETPPTISYHFARPYVQLVNKQVNITCIATDNVGIDSVTVFITPPKGLVLEKKMTWSPLGKYVYNNNYDTPGKYLYYIRVVDKAGEISATDFGKFWITKNLDDTDNDGMPNSWENEYNFNPEDPVDAEVDSDGDGLTNLMEYKAGTNPRKNIFLENVIFRVKDNAWYFALSIVLFLLIFIISTIGKRRRSK